ncbi:MAG: site-specific DNA-methyltransferase [Chloroflexi bacterium]|nr:site-specific DNA-methyltransferase [Chloroflexota bacterium]
MIINGNSLSIPLADKSVQCAITSPPYWGLRDYLNDAQLGLEETPEKYVENMVNVFREVWRILKDDGVLWLNLGDSYNGSGGAGGDYSKGGLKEGQPKYKGRNVKTMKPKDLVGIPWMVAFALRSDGWYLRQDIIWHKPNPMPESVTDRCTKSHEYIFLLTKNARYYYDHEAIKEPTHIADKYETKNKRSVWDVTTKPYKGAHFATFPADLVEPMVLAGSREGDIVLDPFSGTSTVGQVARKHKRKYAGIELSFDYIQLAKKRLSAVDVLLF